MLPVAAFFGQGREGRKGCVGGGLFGSRGSGILRGGGAESAWRFRPGAASLAPGALEEGSRGGAAVADFGPVAFEEALWAGAIARSSGPWGCLVQ